MRHLERLKRNPTVRIPPDKDGFVGRECPAKGCGLYFKLVSGTGLPDVDHTYCPYCGGQATSDCFFTKAQIKYATAVMTARVEEALHKDLEPTLRETNCSLAALERSLAETMHALTGRRPYVQPFDDRPGPPPYRRIPSLREKDLETVVECDHCTLRYAIYGVFGHCPDCGVHNSRQMLDKNLDLAEKYVALANVQSDPEVAAGLRESALLAAVGRWDGFGREACRKAAATNAAVPADLSFQSLAGARDRLLKALSLDLAAGLTPDEWTATGRAFQKRHLLSHSMGVVDEQYKKRADDPAAVVGRKVTIDAAEVAALVAALRKLAPHLLGMLAPVPGTP
jgi:hypothetical protein